VRYLEIVSQEDEQLLEQNLIYILARIGILRQRLPKGELAPQGTTCYVNPDGSFSADRFRVALDRIENVQVEVEETTSEYRVSVFVGARGKFVITIYKQRYDREDSVDNVHSSVGPRKTLTELITIVTSLANRAKQLLD